MLTAEQRCRLVALARTSIVAQVTGEPVEAVAVDDLPDAYGVFVTIKARGDLRGCLGTLDCGSGLGREVMRCAADAASEDPRFPPVEQDELPGLTIEVSVLSPLEPVNPRDRDAIVVGRHGLVIERGSHRGLLLPQVATEWAWTREQFLRHTCLKAGLHPDAWQHDATVYRFDAEVFGE